MYLLGYKREMKGGKESPIINWSQLAYTPLLVEEEMTRNNMTRKMFIF